MQDDNSIDSSSESNTGEETDHSSELLDAGTDPDTKSGQSAEGEEGEPQQRAKPVSIPKQQYDRVNTQRQEYERRLRWAEENPEKFAEMVRQQKGAKAKQPQPQPTQANGQPLTQEQQRQVREAMLQSYPQLKQFEDWLQGQTQERTEAHEALLDQAESDVRQMAEAAGIKGDESFMSYVGSMVMMAISNDEKASRMFRARNPAAVKIGFDHFQKHFIEPLKRQLNGRVATDKRKVMGLPSAPAGRATTTGVKPQPKGEGITQKTHDAAWDAIQQSLQE
jgi:hypothetical protein